MTRYPFYFRLILLACILSSATLIRFYLSSRGGSFCSLAADRRPISLGNGSDVPA